LIKKLIEICGKENVSEELLDKICYSYDASQKKGKDLLAIVWPKNEEQIRKIVVFCNRSNHNIVVRGSGTNLGGSVLPNNSIVLDLSRMNRIVEINLREGYVTVEPGVILSQLNNVLKKYKYMFPIIPQSEKISTIGGMVGNDSFGFWSLKYGRMFDNIIELGIIDGTGKCLKTQRIRDFVGTEGCLGIVTKAKLKIINKIEVKSLDLLGFERTIDVVNKVKEIKNNENVFSIQYIDKISSGIAKIEKKHYLIIEYKTNEGKIKDEKNIKIIFNVRKKVFNKLMEEKYLFIETPSLDIEHAEEFFKILRKKNIPIISHIGLGVYLLFLKEQQLYELKDIHEKIKSANGKISNFGIGVRYQKLLRDKRVNEIKSLKAKYDPNNILNKGKLTH